MPLLRRQLADLIPFEVIWAFFLGCWAQPREMEAYRQDQAREKGGGHDAESESEAPEKKFTEPGQNQGSAESSDEALWARDIRVWVEPTVECKEPEAVGKDKRAHLHHHELNLQREWEWAVKTPRGPKS